MHGQWLLVHLGISLLIHFSVVLLFFFVDLQPSPSSRQIPASLKAVLKSVDSVRSQASVGGQLPKTLPAAEGIPSLKSSPMVFDQPEGSQSEGGVHEASELDNGITLMSGPSIEPEYGFSDDVMGSVDISVLVAPDGNAALVWHEPSNLDDATVMYIANVLRVTKFSPPKKNGFPVYGIFRMQVEVGSWVDERKN